MTPSAPQEEKAAAEEPSRALSREELIMQDEKARQMYEDLMSLRKSLDSLKDVTVSSAGEVADKAAEKVSERENMPAVENSSDVAAAEKAVIERAKEDNAQRMREQAEKLERERRIKEEQQRALEAQKRAERISEEAERKRLEAIEAERNAKEVARKKALEVMEAERRAREKAILDQHTATPEEMAAFFGGSSERFKNKGRADEEVLDELKEKLITEQEKQDARVNKISEIAGEKTEELAERRDAKIEEVAAVQQKLKDEQEERLRKQQTRTEFEKIKAKEAEKAGREKDLQRLREREERKKRVRAERLEKVERTRAERAERDAEKERIRVEKRAKAAELARLKAQRKADAKLGGGIVHIKGMKISTEINRKPSFRWRDFFGIASIKETIGNISTPSFLSLLEDEERSIRGRIDECNALLDVVSTIRQSINAAAEAEKGRLYTAGFREQSIIRFPIRNSGTDSTSDEAWQEAYRDMIASADCKAIMTMGSIVHLDEAREHLGAICREVYATYAHPSDSSIPAGRYAFMYFQGSLDHLAEFYRMFFEALDSSHFVPIGDIYEELTISSIVTRDEKEHVTRLIVRIG